MEKSISNMEKTKDCYIVPNLEKGLTILEYLSSSPSGLSLQKIKTNLEISQTTAYRILNTLVRMDYLNYDESSKLYKLSRKMLMLGYRSLNEHNLLEVVMPHLYELRDKIKETVCLGVMGENQIVFIEQAQGQHMFRFVLAPGKHLALHCSAPGKAIMAYLPAKMKERILSSMTFERYNKRTITTPEAYLKELDKVADLGYSMDNEEEMSGVICMGAPVFDYTGYPCAAIWIPAPKDRLSKELLKKTVEELKESAKKISSELGFDRKI